MHSRKVETMKKLICLLIVGLLAISCKTTTKSGHTAEQQVNAAHSATEKNKVGRRYLHQLPPPYRTAHAGPGVPQLPIPAIYKRFCNLEKPEIFI